MTKGEACLAIATALEEKPSYFFTDENASSRLLEAMPRPSMEHNSKGGDWCFEYDVDSGFSRDKERKTAIVLAAMRWLHIDGTIEG